MDYLLKNLDWLESQIEIQSNGRIVIILNFSFKENFDLVDFCVSFKICFDF